MKEKQTQCLMLSANDKKLISKWIWIRGIPRHKYNVASSGFLVVIPLRFETQNTKVSSINVQILQVHIRWFCSVNFRKRADF